MNNKFAKAARYSGAILETEGSIRKIQKKGFFLLKKS